MVPSACVLCPARPFTPFPPRGSALGSLNAEQPFALRRGLLCLHSQSLVSLGEIAVRCQGESTGRATSRPTGTKGCKAALLCGALGTRASQRQRSNTHIPMRCPPRVQLHRPAASHVFTNQAQAQRFLRSAMTGTSRPETTPPFAYPPGETCHLALRRFTFPGAAGTARQCSI